MILLYLTLADFLKVAKIKHRQYNETETSSNESKALRKTFCMQESFAYSVSFNCGFQTSKLSQLDTWSPVRIIHLFMNMLQKD